MNGIGYGDLASPYNNSIQNTRVKADLARLGQELASGRKTNLHAATGGNLGGYAGIEAALNSLTAYKTVTAEAGLYADAVQASLGQVMEASGDVALALIAAGTNQTDSTVDVAAADARGKFNSVVSALNSQMAGRSLFAGTAVNGPALADAETMLADLMVAIAGQVGSAGVISAVDDWFDLAGGGFETVGYLGDTNDLADFRVGADVSVNLSVRADSQEIRDQLKGFALAALIDAGALSGSLTARAEILESAGSRMLSANSELVDLQASVGIAQARIEQSDVRNTAETSALETARSKILAIDPFEKATELQAAETQLETLYAITARLSRLSLVDYL